MRGAVAHVVLEDPGISLTTSSAQSVRLVVTLSEAGSSLGYSRSQSGVVNEDGVSR